MDREVIDYMFEQTDKALTRLEEACAATEDAHAFILDATLQRFEFSYEMLWKLLRKIFAMQSIRVTSAWSAFREAHAHGWIEPKEFWKQLITDRNRTVHTYKHEDAHDIYTKVIHEYAPAMRALYEQLKSEFHHNDPWDTPNAKT